MANTPLTPQTAGAFNAGIVGLTLSAVDGTNGNSFVNTGRTVLVLKNANASTTTLTFAIPSSPRTINGQVGSTQVFTVPATTTSFFGPFDPGTFTNTSGLVNFSVSSATSLTAAVVELAISPTP